MRLLVYILWLILIKSLTGQWRHGGEIFFFSNFSFVAVPWLFLRYSFMSTMADAKSLMVEFEGAETLDFALSFWTGYEMFSLCSFLAHYITSGSNESM